MKWILPGTILPADPTRPESAQEMFDSWFLTGGLVLSQVARITGLEPYMVQNWVKRGFLSPPVKKKYSSDQLARIITINMLKTALPMESICGLISAVNGRLDDAGDDTICDRSLYFYFVHLAAGTVVAEGRIPSHEAILETLADFQEKSAGDRDTIARVLEIMLIAWRSSSLQRQAEGLLSELNPEKQ